MSEKQVKKLFQGITGIDGDIVEEARTAPPVKKAPIRRWGAVAACICLALLAGALAWRSAPGESVPGENAPAADGIPRVDGGSPLGDITPTLRVGGTLYRWTGMSKQVFLESGVATIYGDGSTYLPEGYQSCGDISGVTRETPSGDLQLQAEFEASGSVFVSEDYPAVVYVLMTTSWFENSYVRFASDALGENELLSWQGRMYRLSIGTGVCPALEELPEGCEQVGSLHFVGKDSIPTGDLETNRMSDSYGRPFEGREVYAIPGDDSALYVYEHHYWREGDYPTWLKCPVWDAIS